MIAGERISITAPTKKEAENQAAAIKSGAKAARKKTGLTVGEAIDQYVESKDAVLSPATIYIRQYVKNRLPAYNQLRTKGNRAQSKWLFRIQIADKFTDRLEKSLYFQ